MLDGYARDRDASRAAPPEEGGGERMLFLGSKPMVSGNSREARLEWRWRLEAHGAAVKAEAPPNAPAGGEAAVRGDALLRARQTAALLEEAGASGAGAAALYRKLGEVLGKEAAGIWRLLRKGGLAGVRPAEAPRPRPL
jgi:hypothetical protein